MILVLGISGIISQNYLTILLSEFNIQWLPQLQYSSTNNSGTNLYVIQCALFNYNTKVVLYSLIINGVQLY